jgi:hypothetical protein
LAGADSIDDLEVLRSGASPELFDQVRAPSTVGPWLRALGHGRGTVFGDCPQRQQDLHGDRGVPGHRVDPDPVLAFRLDPDTGDVVDSAADVADTTYAAFAVAGTRSPPG